MENNYIIENPMYAKYKVCEYLGGIDDSTLDKWIADGKFPKADLYLGRNPRWKLSTINAHLAKLEQEYKSRLLCG